MNNNDQNKKEGPLNEENNTSNVSINTAAGNDNKKNAENEYLAQRDEDEGAYPKFTSNSGSSAKNT